MLGGWLRNEYFPWQAKVSPFNGACVCSVMSPPGTSWSPAGAPMSAHRMHSMCLFSHGWQNSLPLPHTMQAKPSGGNACMAFTPAVHSPPPTGHTVYRLNKEGLIQAQEQTWSISGFEALRETFTPVPGPRTQLL